MIGGLDDYLQLVTGVELQNRRVACIGGFLRIQPVNGSGGVESVLTEIGLQTLDNLAGSRSPGDVSSISTAGDEIPTRGSLTSTR